MRVVVQRVKYSSCTIDGVVTGKCDKGFMLLIGFKTTDTLRELEKCAKKVSGLRIFEDENGKMNQSLKDVSGTILAISQFTLYADCKHGNRPSFIKAGKPEHAQKLYNYIIEQCKMKVPNVQTGIFGADMKVSLTNDGPFTIVLDSTEIFGI